jgi:hypothetical protein
MSVCDVRQFNDGKRLGYIAILDSSTGSKQNALRYFGADFGDRFKPISADEMQKYKIRNIRDSKEFGRYLKEVKKDLMISPIDIGGIVFDSPYIYQDNNVIAQWRPVFEKDLTNDSFNLISGGTIIEYNYKQPIFISTLDAKRHVPKYNLETLLFNKITGLATRLVHFAGRDKYSEASYHLKDGTWVIDSCEEIPIAGYKLR